jgi:hypothetical protein
MKWGTGESAALARMSTITGDELESIGVDHDMAVRWAAFYRNEIRRHPENGSARGRAVLMEFSADLLGG